MEKVVYVQGYFSDSQIEKFEKEGVSPTDIDAHRLTHDITEAINILNYEGFSVISITPVTGGVYKYNSGEISSAHRIFRDTEKISGTGGFGYGYSYTSGVIILACKSHNDRKDNKNLSEMVENLSPAI